MDKLPEDMIGLYEQYFEFSGIRVPFSAFLLAVIKHFRVHISQLVPLGLNRLTMFELYYRSLGAIPSVNLFRVFYKISKQGHWFSFEKWVGKGAGGQIFRETFSGLKGWKKRFFFLDRRAIPDAMAWRHHDSDVNDPVPKDGFNASDVQMRLATTWDFPGLRPILKDTEGNVVTMFEYLRFPFLYGASIYKRPALTSQDQIEQHIARPFPSDQAIPEKTDHQKIVEGSHLATKRRKTAARKDGSVAFEATSSPEPIRTINPTGPSDVVAEIAESQEDHSPRMSPRGSADHSVHNYSDVHHNNEEADTLRLGTSRDQSERAMTNVDTEVVQPSPSPRATYHSPVATQPASLLRPIQRGNVEAGESSRRGPLYVPDWSIHQRCRLDTPMWCQELMVHLAPPAAQEESNALKNAIALERAWFSLARGGLAQTDILGRFETLQADFGEHNSLSDRYKAFRSEHEGCARKLEGLENCNRELSQVNKDQALRIKELEDTLAKKDSALVYAERINVERAQEKEKLVSQLGRAEMEKFNCIRKLLPTVVEHLLQSHKYQQSLSEPFNLAIQAGWGK
ncbi:hypothetical protein Tco_0768808 [Tanacetum coccineum]